MRDGLTNFRIRTFAFPRDRRIGDCKVAIDMNWVGALELFDADGLCGLGFFLSLFAPLPPALWLRDYLELSVWPSLVDCTPEGLIHRVSRPRGGKRQALLHDLASALDQALWDLSAKRAGLPLWRYVGGASPRVPAYASGLEFHLDDKAVVDFYAAAVVDGYQGFKVKVGHPDLQWDLRRLQLVREIVGPAAQLMVDANEAWTPAEAVVRLRGYEAAGLDIHWVEDPVLRDDHTGLAHLRGAVPGVRVNAGEYLGLEGKLALLQAGAVDLLQVNGLFSESLHVASAAGRLGVPIAVGNTTMNIGAHLAAALPETERAEDSRLNTTLILRQPLAISDGAFVLTDLPGHGLVLAEDALTRFSGDAA